MSQYQVGRQYINEVGNSNYQTGRLLINDVGAALYDLTANSGLTLQQSGKHQLIVRTAANNFLESFQVGSTFFNGTGGNAYQSGMYYYFEAEGVNNQNHITLHQFAQAEVVPSQRITGSVLTLTQEAIANIVRSLTASNTLSLTQAASSGLLTRSAYNSLSLTHAGHFEQVISLSASSSLSLTQAAAPGLLTRSAYNTIPVAQNVDMFTAGVDAIDLTASNTLSLTQANNRYILLAAAIELSAESIITLTQRTIFPYELDAESTITLTQSAVSELGKSAESILDLSHTADVFVTRNLTASHALDIQQAVLWLHYRDDELVSDTGCSVIHRYAPFVGEGSMPIRATPPSLIKQTDVLFFYPAGASCAATTSFTLRTPNFGDRDRNQYNRINRETRGGTLQVFRDPKWPKQRTLMMDFTGVKDEEVDGILEFLEATLGVKVGFRDWEGRVWTGIIMTPDAPIIRNNRNRNDIALELEVDDTELQLTSCSSLALTQGAAAVVDP